MSPSHRYHRHHSSSSRTLRPARRRSPHARDGRRHHQEKRDKSGKEEDRSKGQANTLVDASRVPDSKLKPDFAQSGKLAVDTNTFNGIVVKYNEPPDAKGPNRRWRLYPFKGETGLDFIPIHSQSAYLMGRERRVADIPIDHPSCSLQHAVIQFRAVSFERTDGTTSRRVRPYLIDLESSNGTFLNGSQIEARKYYELFQKDVLKFGFSSRDYVLMHEDVSEADNDIKT